MLTCLVTTICHERDIKTLPPAQLADCDTAPIRQCFDKTQAAIRRLLENWN